jgi:hypothetical protein
MTSVFEFRLVPPHTLASFVIPVYNEARVLRTLAKRIDDAFRVIGCRYEVIFVNDGSHDASGAILGGMAAEDRRIRVLHLLRNFGQQAAVQAGLIHATGDAAITWTPTCRTIPRRFPASWSDGARATTSCTRCASRQESAAKRLWFAGFYCVLGPDHAVVDTRERRQLRPRGPLGGRDDRPGLGPRPLPVGGRPPEPSRGGGGRRPASAAGSALGVDVEGVHRRAPAHEQAIALKAAEAEIGAARGQVDAADKLALRVEDGHAV